MINPKLVRKRLQQVKNSPDGCPEWLERAVDKLLAAPSGATQFEIAAEIAGWLYTQADSAPSTGLSWKTANAYEALKDAINPWNEYWKYNKEPGEVEKRSN